MQHTDLICQWQILVFLAENPAGATVQQLVARTSVADKTIRRDLQTLKQTGFPLTEHRGRRGLKTWRLVATDSSQATRTDLLQLRFTLEEAAALYLGRLFLEPLAGTYFHAGSQTALQKIRSVLSHGELRHLEKMATALYCHTPSVSNYAHQARLIDNLQQAIEDQLLTVIEYQSLRSTEPVTHYDLHPYGLAWHKQALYLIAWSLDHDSIRTFKVDRISAIETKKLKFTRPADFSLQQYLKDSFGIMRTAAPPQRILVRFAAKAARLFQEKTFHPSQQVTREPTGQILVSFELSSLEEFRSWLLSWGPLAEVVEPEILREEIASSLQLALLHYRPAAEPAKNNSHSSSPHKTRRQSN